jgi:hypothetical protein
VKRSPDTLPFDRNDLQLSPGLVDWMNLPEHPSGSTGGLALDPTTSRPPSDAANNMAVGDIVRKPRPPAPRQVVSAPITLSLADDDQIPRRNSTKRGSISGGDPSSTRATKAPRLSFVPQHVSANNGMARGTLAALNSPDPDESADLLYEYFPLGLDDWMPPVDAVYRPHVVHHTDNSSDSKMQAVNNKSKTYFSRAELA